MKYDDLRCASCGGLLQKNESQLVCPSCGATAPLLDGIPVFGSAEEVEQWTRYHTDPDNAQKVASGGYLAETPSEHNAYYSCFIPDGALKVLDAGGGDGNTTSDWAERHPAATVHVMDLSLHGLKKVHRRGLSNMITVCAPTDQRFPYLDNFFDVVNTVFMVEHMSSSALDRFYREAWRVLKPGGRLIVASDTAFYDKVVHPIERLVRQGRYVRNDPTHINLMTPRQCEAGIAKHDFLLKERTIHWVAGRHAFARGIYKILPAGVAEALFSTMYVIVANKLEIA